MPTLVYSAALRFDNGTGKFRKLLEGINVEAGAVWARAGSTTQSC
jgi:hypothetical protein